jgi:hypothetical protein
MTSIDILNYATTQIYIYGYCFIFLTGMIGNSISILMFTTGLKGNPCSLYLLTTEVCDCLEILVWIVPYTIQVIYGKNGTESFLPWCKLMPYLADVFTMMSIATLCLASIDRYHSTCRSVRKRQWSSMKVAKISILLTIFISLLLQMPDLIFYQIVDDDSINYCTPVADTYAYYMNYFEVPFLWTFVPFSILLIFGFFTRRNLRTTRTLATTNNNVQPQKTAKQRVDDQLTRMLVLQIICFFISTVTWSSMLFYYTITLYWEKSDWRQAMESCITSVAAVIYLLYTSSSFYVYYLSSVTYRQRVKRMWKKMFGLRGRLMVRPAAVEMNVVQSRVTRTNRP